MVALSRSANPRRAPFLSPTRAAPRHIRRTRIASTGMPGAPTGMENSGVRPPPRWVQLALIIPAAALALPKIVRHGRRFDAVAEPPATGRHDFWGDEE
jgi:hypothetical protein